MASESEKIKKALRAQDAGAALAKLLAVDGPVAVRKLPAGRLSLVWKQDDGVSSMPIDPAHPTPYALKALGQAVVSGVVRETAGPNSFREKIDAKKLASGFLSDYRKVHAQFFAGARNDVAQVHNRFLTRVLLLRFLQTKAWLTFNGRTDYLQALYEDWKQSPGPHQFYQRLAVVFFSALNEPRPEARSLVTKFVGDVPHLGGGLFVPELFESEMQTEKGFATVPDELFEALLGKEGLLSTYEFSLDESKPSESVIAVTPEVMGAVFEAFLAGSDEPLYPDMASLRLTCREVVARHLGLKSPIAVPSEANALKKFRNDLDTLHVYDGSCQCGSYLVAVLEEVTDLYCPSQSGGGNDSVRAAIKRRVITENIRGLDYDDLAVQVARFRLALSVLAEEERPSPLPDLRAVVKKGGAIEGKSARRLPAEGQRVEYKASFEWDPKRGLRSPELRFATLRTIVAFLNSEGGTLYIGVSDDAKPVGIKPDLDLIEDEAKYDAFQNRFREMLKNKIEPIPLNNVSLAFEEALGVTVLVVNVAPQQGVNYLVHKDQSGQARESVFVRDGNRTVELSGRSRDQFVLRRSGK